MYLNKLKYHLQIFCCILFLTACSNNNAETVYPTNDQEAKLLFNSGLKTVLEEKCISCHNFHKKGSNRYDSFEKTKAAISQIISRINASDTSAMPPSGETQLTEEEKQQFLTFTATLNGDATPIEKPINITWTAYKYPKFDDRAGVSGTFDIINYQLNEVYEEPKDVLKNATISIETNSVNVGNEQERTSNVKSFFEVFTPTIEGVVQSYTDDKAIIAFTMNTIERTTTLDFSIIDNKLILEGVIEDLALFNWQNGYEALEEICGDYHQNKLWPDISIKAEILLN